MKRNIDNKKKSKFKKKPNKQNNIQRTNNCRNYASHLLPLNIFSNTGDTFLLHNF